MNELFEDYVVDSIGDYVVSPIESWISRKIDESRNRASFYFWRLTWLHLLVASIVLITVLFVLYWLIIVSVTVIFIVGIAALIIGKPLMLTYVALGFIIMGLIITFVKFSEDAWQKKRKD